MPSTLILNQTYLDIFNNELIFPSRHVVTLSKALNTLICPTSESVSLILTLQITKVALYTIDSICLSI
jgi:hypothetical protein